MANDLYFIRNHLEALYEERLLTNYPKIMMNITNFINKRMEPLSSKNCGMRVMYTSGIENEFYDVCEVEKSVIIGILKESPNCDMKITLQANPLYALLMYMIELYYRNRPYFKKLFKSDYKEPWELINLYLTIKIYSWTQQHIFKYIPKEDTMEYVINNLNNRFELASAPNVLSILIRYAETNNKTLNINFEHMKDVDMFGYVSKLDTRCKTFLKKIFQQMLIAHEAGKTSSVQNLQATNEDGKDFYIVAGNISNEVELAANKILMNFTQETIIRENLLKMACGKVRCSVTKTRSTIQSIRSSKDSKLLYRLISNIVSYWIISMKQTASNIHSKSFIIQCSGAYSVSHTQNEYILDIRDVLHELITKYSEEFTETEKKGSLVNFKQAVYTYMVLYIASVK